jgi:hypothetical protein
MAPVVVVVLDPGGHPCPGLRPDGEVLAPPSLELQGWRPGLDARAVQGMSRACPSTG